MKLTVFAIAASCLLLGACGGGFSRSALSEADQGYAACSAQKFRVSVEMARCKNAVEDRLATSSPGMEAQIRVVQATRLVLAERVDKGQITEGEADLEFARMNANRVATEDAARRETVRNVASAVGAAAKGAADGVAASQERNRVTECITNRDLYGNLRTVCN